MFILAIVLIIIAAIFVAVSYAGKKKHVAAIHEHGEHIMMEHDKKKPESSGEGHMHKDHAELKHKEKKVTYTDKQGQSECIGKEKDSYKVSHTEASGSVRGSRGAKPMWGSVRGHW